MDLVENYTDIDTEKQSRETNHTGYWIDSRCTNREIGRASCRERV